MTPLRSRIQRFLAFLLVAMPLGLQFLLVRLLGVNLLIWDEWFYVDFIRQVRSGENWLPWLLIQHNEHRVLPMKLAMALLALLTRWNVRAEMYCSAVLAGMIIYGLWKIYRRSIGDDLLLFAPVAWIVCSLSQFEIMLFGMMMCFYFTVLGVVWALVFLAWRSPGGVLLALLCGFMASFSILNGLIVWPAGLFLLLVWRDRPWRIALWVAGGLGSALLYFYDFQIAPNTHIVPLTLEGFYSVARFTLTALGAPLGAGSLPWSAVLGLMLAGLICATLVRWWRRGAEQIRQEALPAALILFALVSCGMIAVGRASDPTAAVGSRYISFSSLGTVGAYLLVLRGANNRPPLSHPPFVAVLALLMPGLLAANVAGLHRANTWTTGLLQGKFLLQTFDRQADEAFAGFSYGSEVREKAPFLRAERLVAFAEPQDLLLLVHWREGAMAGEILPGRPVEQTLVCPVAELWDVAVALSTYGRQNRSQVTLSVRSGQRELARRTLQAAEIGDRVWIDVPLREPLRGCHGRELLVRVESPDAVPGNAVSVWTYPPYFDGLLRQAGTSGLDTRSLGLALNAFHFGILE